MDRQGAGEAANHMDNMIGVQTLKIIAEALQVARNPGVVDGKVLFEN